MQGLRIVVIFRITETIIFQIKRDSFLIVPASAEVFASILVNNDKALRDRHNVLVGPSQYLL